MRQLFIIVLVCLAAAQIPRTKMPPRPPLQPPDGFKRLPKRPANVNVTRKAPFVPMNQADPPQPPLVESETYQMSDFIQNDTEEYEIVGVGQQDSSDQQKTIIDDQQGEIDQQHEQLQTEIQEPVQETLSYSALNDHLIHKIYQPDPIQNDDVLEPPVVDDLQPVIETNEISNDVTQDPQEIHQQHEQTGDTQDLWETQQIQNTQAQTPIDNPNDNPTVTHQDHNDFHQDYNDFHQDHNDFHQDHNDFHQDPYQINTTNDYPDHYETPPPPPPFNPYEDNQSQTAGHCSASNSQGCGGAEPLDIKIEEVPTAPQPWLIFGYELYKESKIILPYSSEYPTVRLYEKQLNKIREEYLNNNDTILFGVVGYVVLCVFYFILSLLCCSGTSVSTPFRHELVKHAEGQLLQRSPGTPNDPFKAPQDPFKAPQDSFKGPQDPFKAPAKQPTARPIETTPNVNIPFTTKNPPSQQATPTFNPQPSPSLKPSEDIFKLVHEQQQIILALQEKVEKLSQAQLKTETMLVQTQSIFMNVINKGEKKKKEVRSETNLEHSRSQVVPRSSQEIQQQGPKPIELHASKSELKPEVKHESKPETRPKQEQKLPTAVEPKPQPADNKPPPETKSVPQLPQSSNEVKSNANSSLPDPEEMPKQTSIETYLKSPTDQPFLQDNKISQESFKPTQPPRVFTAPLIQVQKQAGEIQFNPQVLPKPVTGGPPKRVVPPQQRRQQQQVTQNPFEQ